MSDKGNETMETRVLALVTAPDHELGARPYVQRWLEDLKRSGKSVREHPVLTQVVGLAVATLETEDGSVTLTGLNALVGDEIDALNHMGDWFGRGSGQVVAYVSETGGFEVLWFRMLIRHTLRREWRAANEWRWRNLADTFSVDGRFADVPWEVAAASAGVDLSDALPEPAMRKACDRGDWQTVARGLVDRLNATASLYCSLVGVGVDAFSAATVQGL